MKLIELNCQQYGRIYINADKIDVIYKDNGHTKIHAGGLIWDIVDSVEEVVKMIYQPSDPIQDGMKKVFKDNAEVKKKIDDLTKL